MTGPSDGLPGTDPRPAPVTFVTTEHFTLQGSRAATIAESTSRATMFLSAVSGGLVALGLMATATRAGTTFYAFGLVILPTLAFIGVVTFERTLQTGIEDHRYGQRIARLRAYYFDHAPELTAYLLSVEPRDRLAIQGLGGGWLQGYRTVAGMIAVITAVLTGSAAGLIAAVASGHSLAVALGTGVPAGVITLLVLMLYQQRTWQREGTIHLHTFDRSGSPTTGAPDRV